MKPSSGFIISIFLLLLIAPFYVQAQQKKCSKVDVTVKINDSRNGQPGSITVTSKGDAKFMLHLLSDGQPDADQTKITTGTINNIKPGTYDLVIHYNEGRYCSETRKVTVN